MVKKLKTIINFTSGDEIPTKNNFFSIIQILLLNLLCRSEIVFFGVQLMDVIKIHDI
jgi:hypothetical protein